MMILFPSLSPREIIGFSVSVIGLILAAGGGIGGGGILMPIYILILEFPVKRAIPLVNVTVFGGAIANTILNVPKRHPLIDRPLVDWDLILVMEPLTMAGALVGAVLAKLLPSIVLNVSLVAVLSATAYKTLQKGKLLHQKETERKLRKQQEFDRGELTALIVNSMIQTREKLLFNCEKRQNSSNMDLLEEILDNETHVPRYSVIAISALFLVVVTSNILKGGGNFASPLNITCGSLSYWAVNFAILLTIFIVAFYARGYLLRKASLKRKAGYPQIDGDIIWDERTTIFYPATSTLAGCVAGLFGLGGGIVKGPLMIAMGINPSVASATSAVMILFTSFTATTSFAVFGLLDYNYAVICVTLGFFATLMGQLIMERLVEKYERQSYIIFVIGTVVAISCILMTVESFLSLTKNDGEQAHGKGAGLCNPNAS